MTPTEEKLWSRLRRRQLSGHKFRRQHPMGPYFLDFFCLSAKLAIEVDGGAHESPQKANHDRQRDASMQTSGIRVLRFTDEEIQFKLDSVLAHIAGTLEKGKSV